MNADPDGTKRWLLHGKRHRIGGPAIIWPHGEWRWFHHGKIHRSDGPAKYVPDYYKYYNADMYSWYLNDNKYSLDEWLEANDEISEEQKVMLKLKYG